MRVRALNLFLALAAALAGAMVAAHHPLQQPVPILLFVAIAAASGYWPSAWLVALPALIPLVGLAPWSGWLTFEETDLMVLAIAAGGYARSAIIRDGQNEGGRTSKLLILLATATSVALLISMARGFADAGGFDFGWYQGYEGPMNSVRVGKSFFLALLLIPLWDRLRGKVDERAGMKLAIGLAAGLGSASLAASWERLAFTDLLNFSSDYRTTGLFWEMHVGGAALDGWLALTAPFGIWAMRTARTHGQWVVAAGVLVVAAYASLTTFSRGLYLAIPISLAFLGWHLHRQQGQVVGDTGAGWRFGEWAVAVIVLGLIGGLVFPGSGYRGLLAALGLVALSLWLPATLRHLSARNIVIATVGGALGGLLLTALAGLVAKGPYLLYAVVVVPGVVLALINQQKPTVFNGSVFLASFVTLAFTAVNLAAHWGGVPALYGYLGALAVLLVPVLLAVRAGEKRWPTTLRAQGSLLVVTVAVFAITAMLGGGAYVENRFSTTGQDLAGRIRHWQHGVAMLNTGWDVAFGKGLGRFPANYFFAIPDSAFPGTYRLLREGSTFYLRLSGARHPTDFGDLLRVSQRLPAGVSGPLRASVTARTEGNVTLHLETCEKHLLYAHHCQIGRKHLKQANGDWQTFEVSLAGTPFKPAAWYGSRFKVFSLAVQGMGKAVDIAHVSLTGSDGKNLLTNGSFRDEMAHWFSSSDRDHLPWHAKSVFVHVLVDQGVFGVVLFAVLTIAALGRLTFGKARDDPLAPFLGAAIIGWLAVGLFDSLLDVPRLALVYYFVTLLALMLGEKKASVSRRRVH